MGNVKAQPCENTPKTKGRVIYILSLKERNRHNFRYQSSILTQLPT